MTTNTYQALCDDVELEKQSICEMTCKGDLCSPDCKYYENKIYVYPPQSSEQRERLEELILKLGRLSYHKSDIYYICILSRVNNANNGMAGTRHEALYALTHKLFKEGVLSKEEVKDCLIAK